MNKDYIDNIPMDYFNNLLDKVNSDLKNNSSVLISAMYGCGGKTFLNLFVQHSNEIAKNYDLKYFSMQKNYSSLFNQIEEYVLENYEKKKIVIIRFLPANVPVTGFIEKLYNLRQPYPSNLIFLIITNHTGIVQPEFFSAKSGNLFGNYYSIPPFDFKDASQMIEITKNYYKWQISKDDYKKIYEVSGGIPRFIKYICQSIDLYPKALDDLPYLFKVPSINYQLNYLSELIYKYDVNQLKTFGLVDDNLEIISLLLRSYFKMNIISVLNDQFPSLSDSELSVLTYLYKNINTVVSIDKLANLMYMTEMDFSLWAIYKLISRLRTKIKNKFKIINVKGKGYMLKKH